MKLLLLLFSVVLVSCGVSDFNAESEKEVVVVENIELIKGTQKKDKLGEYQKFFIAPYKGGDAIIDAANPKGLDGNSLAIYWLQDNNQPYAINYRAEVISPNIARYHQLPFEINPVELLAAVKEKY